MMTSKQKAMIKMAEDKEILNLADKLAVDYEDIVYIMEEYGVDLFGLKVLIESGEI